MCKGRHAFGAEREGWPDHVRVERRAGFIAPAEIARDSDGVSEISSERDVPAVAIRVRLSVSKLVPAKDLDWLKLLRDRWREKHQESNHQQQVLFHNSSSSE